MPAERRSQQSAKPATARVFFALWPTPEIADCLETIARNAALSFGGRATRRDTIHLTLAFLGNVPEERLHELSNAAAKVRIGPYTLKLDQLGFWAHNHLLWAGSWNPDSALLALSSQLRRVLAQAGFRVGGEGRDFVPHVTLVRHLPESSAPSDIRQLPTNEAIRWRCERFVLVRSTLSPLGSTYRVIDEFPLLTTKMQGCE